MIPRTNPMACVVEHFFKSSLTTLVPTCEWFLLTVRHTKMEEQLVSSYLLRHDLLIRCV